MKPVNAPAAISQLKMAEKTRNTYRVKISIKTSRVSIWSLARLSPWRRASHQPSAHAATPPPAVAASQMPKE
jgi:hypothetical protein